jgi:hypothetical protein
VEQTAEEVAPRDLQRMNYRCGRRTGSAAPIRRSQVERSVWTLLIEVADVDAEDVLELAATEKSGAGRGTPEGFQNPVQRGIRVSTPATPMLGLQLLERHPLSECALLNACSKRRRGPPGT